MRARTEKRVPVVIYEINANCLDLDEFTGIFAGRKKKKLYESVMMEIADAALDLFDIDTITFGHHDNHFHILIWTARDDTRMARAMHYMRDRFAGGVNRSLGRNGGPVWDGPWSYAVRRLPAC
ncbi:MAG: hypothetical protein JXA07_00905 [Spirochaetes bacterium]|nr:hypothetical protein [Spirochaetota bacterium]